MKFEITDFVFTFSKAEILHILSHLIFRRATEGNEGWPHFIDEKSEAQKIA
jgi:hypothetical protein